MKEPTVRPQAMMLALLMIGILLGVHLLMMRAPQPKGINAPIDVFSAKRAKVVLDNLIGDGTPHPAGTRKNQEVRQRITDALASLGYDVEHQDSMHYVPSRSTFYSLQNIMAKLPGQQSLPAVAIVAHHDSVGAGCGASDDMLNVALILEIARILKRQGPMPRPVILLVTDGEELGLLGAKLFMNEHPWAAEIGTVINLEARGTDGRSIMFETSDMNSGLIDAYAHSVSSPEAVSVSYEIYKRMPNDTDFTIFKQAGIQGLNFAFVQNQAHYHTSLDNLENVSLGSLQHQGDCVLQVLKQLSHADPNSFAKENQVYYSLFGTWFLHWPAWWNPWIAGLDTALLVLIVLVLLKQHVLRIGELGWGLLAWFVVVLVSVFGAAALLKGIAALSGTAQPWYASPLPAQLALAGTVLFLGWTLGRLFAPKAGYWGLSTGNWFVWAILAILSVYWIPLASFVFLVPLTLAVGVYCLVCMTPLKHSCFVRESTTIILALKTAILWIGMAVGMVLAFGLTMVASVALPIALMVTSILPLCCVDKERGKQHRLILALVLMVIVASSVTTLYVQPFSALAPQKINLFYEEDSDRETAQWIAQGQGPLPETLKQEAGFTNQYRGFPKPGWVAQVSPIGLQKAKVDLLETKANTEETTFVFSLQKAEWVDQFQLLIPETIIIRKLMIDGRVVNPKSFYGYHSVWIHGIPEAGITVRITTPNKNSLSFLMISKAYGLPTELSSIHGARGPKAVPVQWGDATRLIQRIFLKPTASPDL